MIKITDELLDKYLNDFLKDDTNVVAMNTVCNNGISKSCTNYGSKYQNNHNYSITIDVGNVCNQKQSGRCWMFAALNFMRVEVMKNLNLANMELSQSYPLFYDKLEKANFFLECIIDSLSQEVDSREVSFLLHDPMQDGGQWDMFKNLVKKYGVVPQEVMPEVNLSSATRELDRYLTLKLREFAKDIRNFYKNGKTIDEIRLEKDNMFDKENIGHFWEMIETRPYMRARNRKLTILMDLGRYTDAIKECEEMLNLCESDNLGIRYTLIGLYCTLEKFEECEKLYKKFNEYSAFMLFPMAIMYFKKGDYKKSKKFLKDVQEANPYIIKILKNDIAMIDNSEDIEYYAPGSKEEASIIITDLFYLLGSVPSFITFMEIELK